MTLPAGSKLGPYEIFLNVDPSNDDLRDDPASRPCCDRRGSARTGVLPTLNPDWRGREPRADAIELHYDSIMEP